MDNQHRKISGYRELNQAEIDLINEIKELDKQIGGLIDKVNAVNEDLSVHNRKIISGSDAFRWSAIAKIEIQQGIMALTRAVAKPKFF